MNMLDDLLAGRRRLAIFTEPVPDEAYLPYVDCGALLAVQAAFVERPIDPTNLAYTLYARADAVDPVLALVAAKCGLHRGTPVGDEEQRALAARLGIEDQELERFLALPPILRRQRPDLPRPERMEKLDRIRRTLEQDARRRGWRLPVAKPTNPLDPAELEKAETKELDVMLAGSKPVAMFGGSSPEAAFQPHVDRGAILRLDVAIGESPVGTSNIPETFYLLPGETARLCRLVMLERQALRGERPADIAYDREVGRALGYSEAEIDRYVADSPNRREQLRRIVLKKRGFDIDEPDSMRRRVRDRTPGPREEGPGGER
jgi:hypothetical protein